MEEIKLSLENFRNEMDEKVLERGWFYFSKGWVLPPKEVLPLPNGRSSGRAGFYESVVNEVVPHAISYSIDENDFVDDVFCTCGDDHAPWCRHLAAVLYKMEADSNSELPVNEHITE